MRIDEMIRQAARRLAEAGIAGADLDARLLFQHLTSLSASEVVLRGTDPADEQVMAAYRRLVDERAGRVPLHYLTGTREFWSMDFLVSPAVLIPARRPNFCSNWRSPPAGPTARCVAAWTCVPAAV